jgi:hypothetical protein
MNNVQQQNEAKHNKETIVFVFKLVIFLFLLLSDLNKQLCSFILDVNKT